MTEFDVSDSSDGGRLRRLETLDELLPTLAGVLDVREVFARISVRHGVTCPEGSDPGDDPYRGQTPVRDDSRVESSCTGVRPRNGATQGIESTCTGV